MSLLPSRASHTSTLAFDRNVPSTVSCRPSFPFFPAPLRPPCAHSSGEPSCPTSERRTSAPRTTSSTVLYKPCCLAWSNGGWTPRLLGTRASFALRRAHRAMGERQCGQWYSPKNCGERASGASLDHPSHSVFQPYRHRNDAKTVSIIALGCFHPVTKVQSASLHFFLGSDEEKEDSDDEEEDVCALHPIRA